MKLSRKLPGALRISIDTLNAPAGTSILIPNLDDMGKTLPDAMTIEYPDGSKKSFKAGEVITYPQQYLVDMARFSECERIAMLPWYKRLFKKF